MHIEVVVAAGLEALANDELRQLGRRAILKPASGPGVLPLSYSGDLRDLLELRVATSVYLVREFAVPRPRALLGDQHLRGAQQLAATALRLHAPGSFQSLFLSAAGADSAVLTRLKEALASHLGLTIGSEDGDLLLRLRRASSGAWELLVRLTPRPLATRTWRVCNREGALNGPVAYAMAQLTRPKADDHYLNIGCGSGSLLIERLLLGPAQRALGCDTSGAARTCAAQNLGAAGLHGRYELTDWDARALPLATGSISAISADLPFGHLVGSHDENLRLYPAILDEAARVARPGARCALLSHEVRLMERLLAERPVWHVEQALRVDLGGLYPRIFLLRRTDYDCRL
ncbi:methyltransferase domain-containing protein [Candidatus Viridilinea mediisalina]|uniref:RNA methyltransferase n=1 Tax=Candidatus Viridilinea mediisalina TaxID=2024553 RepID=A0A2A6RFR9_9CHLR|nr:methyltransferase domain-containing protein [Candidatus Viridilinea mediisalina]PDW01728.1 RNA methyltransferase [Candidatus Viridilinea mediisalina]